MWWHSEGDHLNFWGETHLDCGVACPQCIERVDSFMMAIIDYDKNTMKQQKTGRTSFKNNSEQCDNHKGLVFYGSSAKANAAERMIRTQLFLSYLCSKVHFVR
jgi:hypothetical protein